MKDEEVKRRIMTLAKFKPNPNHYIIVDKWNRKEYNKVKFKIFDLIEEEINKAILNQIDFPSTIEKPMSFWELYKNNLPLWSNINTNCYVKLKESNNEKDIL